MKTWGKIEHNKARGTYAVKGVWQGKRVYFSQIPTMSGFLTCSTEDHAKHLQIEISREIDNGTFNPARYKHSRPLHVAQYAEKWLAMQRERVPETMSYVTWRGYRSYINNHIIPMLGNEYLPYINHEKLQKFVNQLSLTQKGKKNVYACLWKMLCDAKKSGYIPQMPDGINFSLDRKAIKWMDEEAFQKVLAEIEPGHRPIIQFIRLTGVRPSEARALRKTNVKQDRIEITHTFAPVPGGEELKIVKNKREDSIPLYDTVQDLLDSLPPTLSEFVFVNPTTGKPYSKNINREVWNTPCKKIMGTVVALNHAGRHSFGTMLAKAGVDLSLISKMLRHTDLKVTRDHYAEPDMNVMKTAVDRVQKIR